MKLVKGPIQEPAGRAGEAIVARWVWGRPFQQLYDAVQRRTMDVIDAAGLHMAGRVWESK